MPLNRPTAGQTVVIVICGAVMVFFGCLGALSAGLSGGGSSGGIWLLILFVGAGAVLFGVLRLAFGVIRSFIASFQDGSPSQRIFLIAMLVVVVVAIGGSIAQSVLQRRQATRDYNALVAADRVGDDLSKWVRGCADRYAHDHPGQ